MEPGLLTPLLYSLSLTLTCSRAAALSMPSSVRALNTLLYFCSIHVLACGLQPLTLSLSRHAPTLCPVSLFRAMLSFSARLSAPFLLSLSREALVSRTCQLTPTGRCERVSGRCERVALDSQGRQDATASVVPHKVVERQILADRSARRGERGRGSECGRVRGRWRGRGCVGEQALERLCSHRGHQGYHCCSG